jgi:hypothetical protein
MALPQHLGTYIAAATQWAVERREGKCPRWVVDFRCLQYWDGTQWVPVEGDVSITAFLTLVNKDGSINEINVQSIVDAYDLPAVDFKMLAELDFARVEVQIVVENRTYVDESTGQQKTMMEVKYLNHRNYEGRKLQSDASLVQDLNAKYGALLRSKFKAKTAAKPAQPAAPATAKAAPVAAPTVDSVRMSAWKEFTAKTPELDKATRTAEWHKTVKAYGAPKAAEQLTLDDWQIVANKISEYGPWKEPPPEPEPVAVGADDEAPPLADADLPF